MLSTKKIFISFFLIIISTVNAYADHVVLNGRRVVSADLLSMEVFQNKGCPISVQFFYQTRVHEYYQCQGEWSWGEVEKLTKYYRDKINIDKFIIYSDVIDKFSYICEKKKYSPANSC